MAIVHLEIHASNLENSLKFYDLIMPQVGFQRFLTLPELVGYTDGVLSLFIGQTDVGFLRYGFHRKRTGLNHIAFSVKSRKDIDKIYREIVMPNKLWVLYGGPQNYREYHPDYYALYLEDPDRIKIEIVYSEASSHPIKA